MNTSSQQKPLVVVGLGNRLMSDEAVGSLLVDRLIAHREEFPNVDFVDAGTGGLSMLHTIAGRQKAVIIDAAEMHSPPATLRKFTPEQARTDKVISGHSLHEADVLKIIEMSRKLDQAPRQIVIFGIQPENLGPGENLSDSLQAEMSEYLAEIARELRE